MEQQQERQPQASRCLPAHINAPSSPAVPRAPPPSPFPLARIHAPPAPPPCPPAPAPLPPPAASLPAYRYIGCRAVELGSGPGLVGILLAKLGARVAITDIGKVRYMGTRQVAGTSAQPGRNSTKGISVLMLG